MGKKHKLSVINTAIAGGLFEVNSRYGDAGAEFLKGLRGVDNQTGQVFNRGLIQISEYKINPEYAENNIKQQAGFAAEVVSVAKKNAEEIIKKSHKRYARSEDVAGYGSNNNTVDIIELLDGKELSTSQMKFIGENKLGDLLKKIARGDGSGNKNDLSRYMEVDKLEVPTEQVALAKKICREQADKLRKQAKRLAEKNKEEANKLLKQADNYDKLHDKITDSGLTIEQAIQYRLHPTRETVKDMISVAHRAGIEGAKLGAAIGGSISVVTNLIAVHSGDKAFSEAMIDSVTDTLKAAGVGYGTAFVGSTVKSLMQQSPSATLRVVAKTGLPGAIMNVCMASSKSIYCYTKGEIDELELIQEVGNIAVGAVSTSLFTVVGQGLIPIPVLGGVIGSMVGGIIVNTFYDGFLQALNDANTAKEDRIIIEMQCEAAKELSRQYRIALESLFASKLTQLEEERAILQNLFSQKEISADDYCAGMNHFALVFGKKLTINNMAELDEAMQSDKPIII
ncbi:hypothetical protein ACFFHK_01700 [Gallibacterium trehalosifermentans]|uniref:Uncharacterized protein n=1 Tax=Gallibacterium trehalosifermentans TaxID=516935 RepID=A0ABV6GYH5_9PAST